MDLWDSMAVATGPALFWLWLFYRRDRWEPEPKLRVLALFLLGAVIAGPVYLIEGRLAVARMTLLDHVLRVALIEELFKFVPVVFVATRLKAFNEPMDGILYAVAAALGFATVENTLYGVYFGVELLVFRIFTSTLVHVGCSGLVGYALGRAKFRAGGGTGPVLGTLGAVIALHGAFNYALETAARAGRVAIAVALPLLLVALFMALNRACKASPFRPPAG
jgi:RsiW-degrading membrane proteinase PrsW (M82 family)